MKRAVGLVLAVCLLTGCSGASKEIERGMSLRAKLLRASQVTFDANITADYGEELYSFSMNCQGDDFGNMIFTVTAPESIAGITGRVTREGGALTFDDVALEFATMADGQVTPVSAPWLFLKTLRSGYLTAAGNEGDTLRLTIDDSYEDDALQLDVWLDGDNFPIRGEVLYDERRIVSLEVENFQIS